MFVSVVGWTIAVLLTVFVALGTAMAYLGRNEHSCDPTCFDVRFAAAFVAFGLFGAMVSASVARTSNPRSSGTRRLPMIGVAIYLPASFLIFFILPGAAPLALIVFIPTGVTMAVMLAARELQVRPGP